MMRSLVLAIALLLAVPIIVSSRADVQPGDVFSITLTSFDDAPAYALVVDSRLEVVDADAVPYGDVLVFPATVGTSTLYATFRVKNDARAGDLIFPGGAVVRICCPGPTRIFFPVFRG